MIQLFIAFLSFSTLAGVFGEDDRISPNKANALNFSLSHSVPALIPASKISKLPSGDFQLKAKTYREMNFCSDEQFVDESLIANCSASLIGPNRILTAAHCLTSGYSCDNYKVVFGYVDGQLNIAEQDVYSCKQVIFEKFDRTLQGDDIAIVELDRVVMDRTPVKLSLKTKLKVGEKLSMIGYPLGMSQKVVEVGEVLSVNKKTASFDHDLDSFSVNSGGPIFNSEGIQVGVLVRGSGANFVEDEIHSCKRWGVEKSGGFASGNLLEILEPFL